MRAQATAASSPAASPAAHAAPTSPAATVPPALSATQSMLPDAACVAANATDDDFLEYSASNSAPPRRRAVAASRAHRQPRQPERVQRQRHVPPGARRDRAAA